jgi:hypothetical protein
MVVLTINGEKHVTRLRVQQILQWSPENVYR